MSGAIFCSLVTMEEMVVMRVHLPPSGETRWVVSEPHVHNQVLLLFKKNFFLTPGIALVPAAKTRMLLYQIMSFQATGKLPVRNTLGGSEILSINGTSWRLTRDLVGPTLVELCLWSKWAVCWWAVCWWAVCFLLGWEVYSPVPE